MRKYFLLFLLSALIGNVSAQTVENIQVEQDGEKLNINYRIGGSTSEQLYFVTLSCSIDGGEVFEPKSVIGDVGANIRGGKSFNTVVWNVFNDVEEVGNVEFFVKVDLVSDEGAKVEQTVPDVIPKNTNDKKKQFDRKFFVSYSGSFGTYYEYNNYYGEGYSYSYIDSYYNKSRPFGLRVGTLGNWGLYGVVRYGSEYAYDDYYDENYDYLYYEDWYYTGLSVLGGVTKYIIGNEKHRLHAYAGLGIGDWFDEFNVEAGLIGVIANRITVDVGLEVPSYYAAFSIGVGVVF